MSESDTAAAPPESKPQAPIDHEDRLRPEFVDKVLDAVEAGDDETARELVQPLHPADIADLIELAARDEREGLVKALAGIISPDVLAVLNGLTIAFLIGVGVTVVLGSAPLGGVIAAAILVNIIVAGFAGVLVPLTLERAGADPAVASSVFVTMITDSMGFLLFLGLATAVGLVR